jgi:hypothetical protein
VIAPDQRGYGRTTGWDDSYDADPDPFRILDLPCANACVFEMHLLKKRRPISEVPAWQKNLAFGRSRMHDPSASQSPLRLGCLWGTFSPSRCQIRSTRLSLIVQPAWRRSAAVGSTDRKIEVL